MPKKKTYGLLAAGLVMLTLSILFAIYAYNTTYAQSKEAGEQLVEIKASIQAIENETANGNKDDLDALTVSLSAEKLALERPYSFGLVSLFFAVLLFIKGLYNALVGVTPSPGVDVKRLAQAGILTALCYIGFSFFKIDIPVGPEKTAFHFGNVFCVLAALLLGGYWGGMAGALGMTFADLTTSYVTSAPKTFILKLCIGLIVGLVAHRIFKLSRPHSTKYVTGVTILACICGMSFNIVADPIVGYFYKMYLLGVPQELSAALAKMSAITTSVNAVVAIIAASCFYLALRPALKKSGLFVHVTPENEE